MTAHQPLTKLLSFTIAFIGMLAFLQVYSIQSILPILKTDYHANEVQLGLAVGATVLGMALTSPFIGMISDAFAPTIHSLTLLRLIQGCFVPGMTVCLLAYLSEEFSPQNTAKLTSYYVTGTVCGGFFGRFILGHLSEHIPWQHAMILMATLNLIGFLLVLWQLPASQHFIAKPKLSTAFNTLINHLNNRLVRATCALGFCVLFSLVGCFSFINLHLASDPYHLNTGELANLFTVYLIGMVITPAATWLIKRIGATRTMTLAILISALGIITTASAPLAVIIVGLTLMCTGVFITQSATISYLSLHIHEGRSLAIGLYYMSYYLGGTVGSWICALSYQYHKWSAVIITLLIIQTIALTIIAIFIAKK